VNSATVNYPFAILHRKLILAMRKTKTVNSFRLSVAIVEFDRKQLIRIRRPLYSSFTLKSETAEPKTQSENYFRLAVIIFEFDLGTSAPST
jgi:hypothetical protein